MFALMQKFTLIVSLSQSDSNLKSKREHQIAIENTTSSYRFDELFLRIVKIEHRIDQDNLYQLTYQEKTRGSTDDGQFKKLHEIFFFAVVIWALWAGQSTDTGAGLNSGRLSLTKALV